MGLIKEAGPNNTEFLQATQGTLVRKPYIQTAAAGVFAEDAFTFEPYLASSYEVSEDGTVYTFELSDAVSNAGNELTADDVLWSFEMKFGAETSTARGAMNPVITDPATQIAKIDDKTVSFTLHSPGHGDTLLSILSDALAFIYDSTVFQDNATDEDPWAIVWAQENPNHGFGPYLVADYEVGSYARFEASENWILGVPDIKTVNVQIVPDAGTRTTTLRGGDADIAERLAPADAADLEGIDGILVPSVPNPNQDITMSLVTNKAPFDDRLVRRAMSHAIPYDLIIENVYQGRALYDGPGLVFPNTPGFDGTGLEHYEYDPERARELLAEAGYPDGLQYTLTVSSADAESTATAVQIQSAAREAGFEIEINSVSGNDFNVGRYDKRWQALVSTGAPWTLTPIYVLNLPTAADSQNNMADWEYEPFYAAFDAITEIADQQSAEAGAAFNAAERIILEEVPFIQIAVVQPGVALSTRIDGYAWKTNGTIDYAHLTIAE